jgi:hypothetical protein
MNGVRAVNCDWACILLTATSQILPRKPQVINSKVAIIGNRIYPFRESAFFGPRTSRNSAATCVSLIRVNQSNISPDLLARLQEMNQGVHQIDESDGRFHVISEYLSMGGGPWGPVITRWFRPYVFFRVETYKLPREFLDDCVKVPDIVLKGLIT